MIFVNSCNVCVICKIFMSIKLEITMQLILLHFLLMNILSEVSCSIYNKRLVDMTSFGFCISSN
jgi:hypothetical protein